MIYLCFCGHARRNYFEMVFESPNLLMDDIGWDPSGFGRNPDSGRPMVPNTSRALSGYFRPYIMTDSDKQANVFLKFCN